MPAGSPPSWEPVPRNRPGVAIAGVGGVAAAHTETPERQTQRLQWTADGTGFAVLVTTCGEPVDVVRLFEFARSID